MSWITATYRVRAAAADIASIATALALEQSVEVPAEAVRDAFVAREIMGRVHAVRDLHDGTHAVAVSLATATTGGDVAQAINMLFGNSSLHAHVELVDVEFPDDFRTRFAGPRHGLAGIRAATGVFDRPLTCAALKPQGLPVAALAQLAYTLACAGIDVIKDDHGLADQAYAPFAQRVAAVQRAIQRAAAATGRRILYAPSLVGAPSALRRQAQVLRDEGVGMALVAPALVGMPAFAEVVATQLEVPVLAHPAYAGAARVAPPLLLGKLFRWLGADAVIFPHAGGRFAYDAATCAAIAEACRAPWPPYRAALPVPAGGLSVERVAEVVGFYGPDVMLLIGGSLLLAGAELPARTAAFVAAVAQSAAVSAPLR
jgi:ribulose-bisphosphate carboxylase large chain